MDPLYLDYAATTPMRPEVRDAMEPFLMEDFGNSGSTHRWGRRAQAAIEESRAEIAELLGAERREIVFVRGGTESDNLALLGRAEAARGAGHTPHLAVATTEHKAVLETATAVQNGGGRATLLPVDSSGLLDMDALDRVLKEQPACVSCMWVNNETGVVQPIQLIADRCMAAGVAFHTDAVQTLGKLPVRVDDTPVSLLSLTGHKIYGPKSTGALFVRSGVELASRIYGGGQEAGIRPGTLDTAGIVGLATAIRLAVRDREEFSARMFALRDHLLSRLRENLPSLTVNGGDATRAGHILSVGLSGVSPEMLMVSLDMEGLGVSGGSACTSGSTTGSHVLQAMLGDDAPDAVIRYSFGRSTTREDLDRAAEATVRVVERLRAAGRRPAAPQVAR